MIDLLFAFVIVLLLLVIGACIYTVHVRHMNFNELIDEF